VAAYRLYILKTITIVAPDSKKVQLALKRRAENIYALVRPLERTPLDQRQAGSNQAYHTSIQQLVDAV
jgi:hypothetical protein